MDLAEGQKSGAFLDLRGLRKWITLQKWAGYRVLNLFSYSGTLGLAAEVAGAREVLNVDVSQGALDSAKKHNAKIPGVQKYLAMDIFEALPTGQALLLTNDHDPKPLYYQFQAESTGLFSWDYIEQGPERWQVRIGKTAESSASPAANARCCGAIT